MADSDDNVPEDTAIDIPLFPHNPPPKQNQSWKHY